MIHAILILAIAAIPLEIIIRVWPLARDYLRACQTPEHEDTR